MQKIETSFELNLPLFDRFGDQVTIYVKRHSGTCMLSDDGYFITNLTMSGFKISQDNLKLVWDICRAYELGLSKEYEICTSCLADDLDQAADRFGEALLKIDQLAVTQA